MKREPQGFVLVAVIWFIAVIALVTAIIGNWMSNGLQGFAGVHDRIMAEQELMSATDQVAYLMVSNYFSARGLEVLAGDAWDQANQPRTLMLEVIPPKDSIYIALDGRPYRFGHGVVALQDNKGLFNLSDAVGFTFSQILEQYGVPVGDREMLYDRLEDYQNKGPFKRLNGATHDDYLRAGRTPPRDAPIITPWEPLRILGWDAETNLWTARVPFWDVATVSQSHGINPNTAPPMVLRTLPGLDDATINKLIEYRSSNDIGNIYHMQEILGRQIQISPLMISPFPGNNLRLKVAFPNDPMEHIVQITLTPAALAPYRIDYAVELPKAADMQASLAATEVPGFPSLAQIP